MEGIDLRARQALLFLRMDCEAKLTNSQSSEIYFFFAVGIGIFILCYNAHITKHCSLSFCLSGASG